MSIVRLEGKQDKPWVTKIKVNVISEDEHYIYAVPKELVCCAYHRTNHSTGIIAYPKYAWKIDKAA